MPLYTFKVIDNTNNYYIYILSRFNDPELALEHVEHASGAHPEDPIHNYFNFIGWDSISIAPDENIKPSDVVNNALPADDKCMNLSDSYVSLIVLPEKKKRTSRKTSQPQADEPKKEKSTAVKKAPKPKPNKQVKTDIVYK